MRAAVTTDGKRVLAKIDYDGGRGPRAAKNVPGARADWDKSVTPNVFLGWSYPLSMDTCRALRKEFGPDLQVLPALAEWARTQIAKENSLEDIREEKFKHADFARVKQEAPALYKAINSRPYQILGAAFILVGKHVILGDDPGLGKTLQALAAIIENDAKEILVACRRTATRTVWERETARWAPGIATFVAQGSRDEREAVMDAYADHDVSIPGTRKMLIINIEMVQAKRMEMCPVGLQGSGLCIFGDGPAPKDHPKHEYHAIPKWGFLTEHGRQWDTIVFDESHNLLASTANIQSKRITQARFGAVQIRKHLAPNGLAIALSGTPFRSKLEKGWGTLNWLDPKLFSSYWRWAETHFGVEQGRFGKIVGGGGKVLEPRDEQAWDRMLRPFYLKREKKDAAPDLPPITYAGTPIDPEDPDSPCYVQLDMDPAQSKAYWQMESLAEATLANGRITATGVLAEITRLRQFATATHVIGEGRQHLIPQLPSNKLEWLIDFIQEREDTNQKVVVASSFSSMVELAATTIRKECGLEVLTLTGATSDRDRADLVARFQNDDDLRVVCINRDAGGESITLDAADEMVVLDMPWISDRDEQLFSRIHRVSRIHNVEIYRLVSTGTIDQWIALLNEEQRTAVSTYGPKKLSELAIAGSNA
jgi:SNF2 family DNA or RNA helicase